MKLSAPIVLTLFLLTFVGKTYASTGGSSVNVKINNSLNSGNSTSYHSSTSTKVNINQEGEGTSEVKINGKEWKVEGPGDINVNESSETSPAPTQSTNPTLAPVTPTPNEEISPTPMPDEDTNPQPSFGDTLKERFEELRESLVNFFSKIFKI